MINCSLFITKMVMLMMVMMMMMMMMMTMTTVTTMMMINCKVSVTTVLAASKKQASVKSARTLLGALFFFFLRSRQKCLQKSCGLGACAHIQGSFIKHYCEWQWVEAFRGRYPDFLARGRGYPIFPNLPRFFFHTKNKLA